MTTNSTTRSLVFAATLALLLGACSLYRSSDREQFDGDPLKGAPNGGQSVGLTACGGSLTQEEAEHIFSSPLTITSLSTEPQACKLAGPALGASSVTCSFPHDKFALQGEGLDLTTQTSASILKTGPTPEYAAAKSFLFNSEEKLVLCRIAWNDEDSAPEQINSVRAKIDALLSALLRL